MFGMSINFDRNVERLRSLTQQRIVGNPRGIDLKKSKNPASKTFRTAICQTKRLFDRQKRFNKNVAVLLRTSAFYRASLRLLLFQRCLVKPQCNVSSLDQGVVVRSPITFDAGFTHLGGLLYTRGSCAGLASEYPLYATSDLNIAQNFVFFKRFFQQRHFPTKKPNIKSPTDQVYKRFRGLTPLPTFRTIIRYGIFNIVV